MTKEQLIEDLLIKARRYRKAREGRTKAELKNHDGLLWPLELDLLNAGQAFLEYMEKVREEVARIAKIRDELPAGQELGSWECPKSPHGLCVYVPADDPCRDSCIYCGDPEERK